MGEQPVSVEVLSADLRTALRRMAKLGRGTPGPGTWSVGAHGLKIIWMGASEVIEGTADGEVVAMVDGQSMRGLAKVSSWPAKMIIRASANSLKVGPTLVAAEIRGRPPPQLLPLNTEPRDLVRLHARETPARIADAGLSESVADALTRLDASCATAARTLGWLGISAAELREWAVDRFAPQAPEFVLVEPTGQVRLFDEA